MAIARVVVLVGVAEFANPIVAFAILIEDGVFIGVARVRQEDVASVRACA